jgi:type VI secretion system protein VasD
MHTSIATHDASITAPARSVAPRRAMRRVVLLWTCAAAAMQGLAACGTKVILPPPPPPPKPTVVDLELKAQDNLNPDTRGRPSPLLVRLYELATPAGFEALPFDALQADDTAGLKPDLVDKREQVIAPGSTTAIGLQPDGKVKFIGVFASFRDLERAKWRAVVPVKGNVTQRVELRFDERSIGSTVSIAPAAPELPPVPPLPPKALPVKR